MFKKLDAFGCFVMTENGKLFRCAILPDGGVDQTFGQLNWAEVKAPVDENFLKTANEALGTHFSLKDFEGRRRQKP